MEISDSHFPYVPWFDSTGKFKLYEHGWNSVRVDNESVYTLNKQRISTGHWLPQQNWSFTSTLTISWWYNVLFTKLCSNSQPPTLHPCSRLAENPILYFHEDMSSSVFKPQWWTCLFGWMSFIPERPHLMVVSWDGWHAYILKKFRGAIQCLKTW